MAVLMSLEDFASYEETRHLLRSAKNAERLMAAIRELDRRRRDRVDDHRVRPVFRERTSDDGLLIAQCRYHTD